MNMENNRRRGGDGVRKGQPTLSGVRVREEDIEPTLGLHWVAWMFRLLAALVFVLMMLQLALGLTSTVDFSAGVLFAEAVRMLILTCVLWGAGALADLFVQSHRDIRATRVLLTRIAYRLGDGGESDLLKRGSSPSELPPSA